MKILINTTPLRRRLTGVGVYTLNVSKYLSNTFTDHEFMFHYVFVSKKLKYDLKPAIDTNQFLFRNILQKIPLGRRALVRLVNSCKLESTDIYFEPNFIPLVEVKARRVVTTVHDFSFLVKEWVPEYRYEYFRNNFFAKINDSDAIITPSEFIRQEVLERLPVDSERVVAIHHGIDHSIFCEGNNGSPEETKPGALNKRLDALPHLPNKFIVFVGALQPRKNLRTLMEAYKRLDKAIKDHYKLVLVGFESWHRDDLKEAISALANHVVVLDRVHTNEHLATIYREASALIFPSLYEGFGFPPVEAMACGCPVVVSNCSSLPEICGDAALYVDPKDIESVVHGIKSILTDETLRTTLKAKGIKRARLFTWDRSAHEHMKVFENVIQ